MHVHTVYIHIFVFNFAKEDAFVEQVVTVREKRYVQ